MAIKSVFHFPNGNVAVCDDAGAQMLEYQGGYRDPEVREAILRDAPDDAVVYDHRFLGASVTARELRAEGLWQDV